MRPLSAPKINYTKLSSWEAVLINFKPEAVRIWQMQNKFPFNFTSILLIWLPFNEWQIMLTIVGFLLAHCIKKFYAQHCHGNFVISNVKLKLNTFAAKLICNICHAWYHTCSKNLIFVDIIYPLVVVLQSKSATC